MLVEKEVAKVSQSTQVKRRENKKKAIDARAWMETAQTTRVAARARSIGVVERRISELLGRTRHAPCSEYFSRPHNSRTRTILGGIRQQDSPAPGENHWVMLRNYFDSHFSLILPQLMLSYCILIYVVWRRKNLYYLMEPIEESNSLISF
jgi:hypothetical protein